MADSKDETITFNLQKASEAELKSIEHKILSRLTEDALKRGKVGTLYNSHGSQHTNNSEQN